MGPISTSDLPAPEPRRDDRGSALVVALMTSAITFALGMSILVLAEMEQQQSRAFAERARSRAAAEAVVRLVASWFSTPAEPVGMPPPEAWILTERRGDVDLDGVLDEACDGSTDAGRWSAHPVAPWDEDSSVRALVRAACGDGEHPDLLLTDEGILRGIASTLGHDVILERIAVHAGEPLNGARTGLVIDVRVAARRGGITGSRVTALGRLALLPDMRSDDAVVAGGDIVVKEGGGVAWGGAIAGGDVHLPRLKSKAFPRSGLPRRPGGGDLGWATGGMTDWNLDTREREYVLTELIGRTVQGERIGTGDIRVPDLPDPWLRYSAAGAIVVGGKPAGAAGSQQPWPYDPRVTTIEDDLSFLFALASTPDPLLAGGLERLGDAASGTTAAGSAMRRFVLDPGAADKGEPRWRENGQGPSRTAQDWLRLAGDRPIVAVFAAGSSEPPGIVRLSTPRGIVLVQAGRLELVPAGDALADFANMPGEPFLDHGIDADGDTLIDPETIANGRWDHDFDGDLRADEEPGDGWELAPDLVAPCFVPLLDQDSTRRRTRPYEPFLNFAYPTEGLPGPVQVRFRAEADGPSAPVADLDGDGFVTPGADRFTTLSRDERGARVLVSQHGHAVIANLSGDVTVAAGYQLVGCVRARGSVVIEEGARVILDEALARRGALSLPLPEATLASVAFPRQRFGGGRLESRAPDGAGEPSDEPPEGRSSGSPPADAPPAGRDRPPAPGPDEGSSARSSKH